jgi:N-acetylglucosamine kinase-like BadF-type ATPase
MQIQLLADSGSTKAEWCLLANGKKKQHLFTQGISPYFLNKEQIVLLLRKELAPQLKQMPDAVFYYGTGCGAADKMRLVQSALKVVFPDAAITVKHDLFGAARALCGDDKGVVAILGTGSNSGYFNGNRIVKNNPGLGYILGDEGSGTYLGKKVLQHVLYNTFEPELMDRFYEMYPTNAAEILDKVYKQPLPNRYLAGFTTFLAENRGHFMVENIIEDGLNDFFFYHIYKYSESWRLPVHFTGSIAYVFRDVLQDLCNAYELELGTVLKNPMEGLLRYHAKHP